MPNLLVGSPPPSCGIISRTFVPGLLAWPCQRRFRGRRGSGCSRLRSRSPQLRRQRMILPEHLSRKAQGLPEMLARGLGDARLPLHDGQVVEIRDHLRVRFAQSLAIDLEGGVEVGAGSGAVSGLAQEARDV